MTVTARTKLSAGRIRRYREGRLGQRTEAPTHPTPTVTTATSHSPAQRRRQAGPTQDQAVYSCSCGYVFEADVSTSVGCPHCGGTQAW
jgi:hypothetical protein